VIPVALFIAVLPVALEVTPNRIETTGQVERLIAATPGEWPVSNFLALSQPIDILQSASLRTSH
jgi:hypothetical protein